jgi:hypothetical protein
MIVRKSKERRHIENLGHKTWMTFDWENEAAPLHNGFGVLKILSVSKKPETEAQKESTLSNQ